MHLTFRLHLKRISFKGVLNACHFSFFFHRSIVTLASMQLCFYITVRPQSTVRFLAHILSQAITVRPTWKYSIVWTGFNSGKQTRWYSRLVDGLYISLEACHLCYNSTYWCSQTCRLPQAYIREARIENFTTILYWYITVFQSIVSLFSQLFKSGINTIKHKKREHKINKKKTKESGEKQNTKYATLKAK